MVTLTFDTLGGPTLEAIEIEKGSILSELPRPEREGYTFDGWSLVADGDLLSLPLVVEGDMTFFALWDKDYYYSNPDGLDGPIELGPMSFSYGLSPLTPLGGSSMKTRNAPAPGEVVLTKTATPVEGLVNV